MHNDGDDFFLIRDFFQRNLLKIRIVHPPHLNDSFNYHQKNFFLYSCYIYMGYSVPTRRTFVEFVFCINPVQLRQYYKNITGIFWILGFGSGIESYSTA